MSHPVELLCDAKGIYGIGVRDPNEEESKSVKNLILRPNRLDEGKEAGAILQGITGGYRRGMFSKTLEESFRRIDHHERLRQAGLPWPPTSDQGADYAYWSLDRKQQIRNRQRYHGYRLASLWRTNHLIAHALDAAAAPEAVRQARRFCFSYRHGIYRAAATSRRALQLTETFPLLAVALYVGRSARFPSDSSLRGHGDLTEEAIRLVERGAPLGQIAEMIGVPLALRKVKPGAAHWARSIFDGLRMPSRLFEAYMPEALPSMKIWLKSVRYASHLGSDFAEWTAKHALEISSAAHGNALLDDLMDWVRACNQKRSPQPILRVVLGRDCKDRASLGEEFVTRPFSPDMSVRTVTELSDRWHDAVAAHMTGPSFEFPRAWYDAGKIGDYEIVPVLSAGDLYLEGHAMHHCVGTYGDQIRRGEVYVYSVRKIGARAATLELSRRGDRVFLGQLRGRCNSAVPREIETAVRKWLRTQKDPRLLNAPLPLSRPDETDFDPDIPF